MPDLKHEETKSFRDPLGEAGYTSVMPPFDPLKEDVEQDEPDQDAGDVESAAVSKDEELLEDSVVEQLEEQPEEQVIYPSVEDYYRGFYITFEADGDDGARFIVGFEGIIGSKVKTRPADNRREILGMDNRVVGVVEGRVIKELNKLEQAGWLVECRMALCLYNQQDKAFSGELVFMAFNNATQPYLKIFESFMANITSSLAFGTRPGMELDQQQFEQLLKSRGTWYPTTDIPLPPLTKGTVIHRRRRSMSDWIIFVAYEHRIGCNIATWIFLAAILAVVIYLFVLPKFS